MELPNREDYFHISGRLVFITSDETEVVKVKTLK